MAIDYNTLNTRQKLNLLGLRIRKEYTKRRHGDSIKISTTEEEAIQESGFMALPTARLAPGKQLYIRLSELAENAGGGYSVVREASEVQDPADSVNMLEALEDEERRLYGDKSIVPKKEKEKENITAHSGISDISDHRSNVGDDSVSRVDDFANPSDGPGIDRITDLTSKDLSDSEFIARLLKSC